MKTTHWAQIALLALTVAQAHAAPIAPSTASIDSDDCAMSYNGAEQHISIGDITYHDPVTRVGNEVYGMHKSVCSDHHARLSNNFIK